MKRKLILLVILLVLVAAGSWYLAANASLSALEAPGALETTMATAAKKWLVSRAAARGPIPPAPTNDRLSVANGTMQFGANCAFCHGQDGRTPTKVGTSLYPRAIRLDATAAQEYSDAELFVIIHDGIRLTGMPGFGRIHSDQEIWNLVHYIRTLGPRPGD